MEKTRIMTLLILLLLCQNLALAESRFELLETIQPDSVSPGEKVKVEYRLKAISLDEPHYYRPDARISWKQSGLSQKIEPDNIVPWKVDRINDGDVFSIAVNIVVNENVPVGDTADVSFGMWRKQDNKYVYVKIGNVERVSFSFKCAGKEQMALGNAVELFPQVTVPRIKAPSIDGKCDKDEWAGAVETGAFVSSLDNKPYLPKTTARLGYDEECLYALFTTEEKPDYQISANKYLLHDSSLWYNDSAEIYFQPSLKDNDYFQFIFDTIGQKYDAYNADFAGYNPVWRTATSISNGKCIFEAAIPFSAITREKVRSGTVWRADFFRYREKGTSLSGWSSTLGGHDQTGRYGYLIFGSAKDALLEKLAVAHDEKALQLATKNKQLNELLSSLTEQENIIRQKDETYSAANFQQTFARLSSMSSHMEKLLFAAKYKESGAPIIIQVADAYSIKPPTANSAELFSALNASFMADETRLFAFNITNISKDNHNIRFSFRYGENPGIDHRMPDYLRLGIPGFKIKWRNVLPAAAKDGTPSYDVLSENPAGVFFIPPEQCIQAILEISPNSPKPSTKAVLVIESIDGKNFDTQVLPVTLTASKIRLADAPEQPLSFGFDFLSTAICNERPDFAEKHYRMIREYGFNNCFISSLHHLPRPKADKEGNIIEEMDFTKLENLIRLLGTQFDGYYLDVNIMEKKVQRKDLFGLDVNDPAFEKAFKMWFAKIIEKCESLGVTSDKLLVCPYDENMGPIALKITKWIKQVSPKTRTIMDAATTNIEELKAYDNLMDVWMPHLRTLNQEGYKQFYDHVLSLKKPVMTYYYSSSNSEKLKSPYSDFALNFWLCFKYNIRGMAYWAAGQYYGDPWHRKNYPGSYDTALIYPTENDVIPSRRLFGWKRGFQDFQLLKLAEHKLLAVGDKAAADTLRRNVELVISYPNEPQRADELRDFCRAIVAEK